MKTISTTNAKSVFAKTYTNNKANNNNLEVLFIGDSFIEGNQLGTKNKDKRFCALVRDAIDKDVFIYGLAGKNSTQITDTYFKQVKNICRPVYAFLEIGTNDNNFDVWLSNMQNLIADMKSSGIIPILVTLTPNNNNIMNEVNEWIRSSEHRYVDLNAVTTTDGETRISDCFMDDLLHLNIYGNQVAFEKIKIDIPEWFES